MQCIFQICHVIQPEDTAKTWLAILHTLLALDQLSEWLGHNDICSFRVCCQLFRNEFAVIRIVAYGALQVMFVPIHGYPHTRFVRLQHTWRAYSSTHPSSEDYQRWTWLLSHYTGPNRTELVPWLTPSRFEFWWEVGRRKCYKTSI